jgi:hypothetical protein
VRGISVVLTVSAIAVAGSVLNASIAVAQGADASADDGSWPILSVLAVVISVISFDFSFWQRRQADITGVQPALVFVFDNKVGWRLENIGNGPALNVIVAKKRPYGEWFEPVRVPPLAKDADLQLHWIPINDENGLGATYNDIRNRAYTTTTGADYSRIIDGHELPERIVAPAHSKFEDREIGVYWALPDLRRNV